MPRAQIVLIGTIATTDIARETWKKSRRERGGNKRRKVYREVSFNSFFCSSLRFHGKNSWIFSGTLPPDAAQCWKYHVSHFRGLSFHIDSVAKIENNAAAR